MNRTTKTQFPILQEGALKEELWEWSDIEALAKTGRLSPNSLIFFADEDVWKKVSDTDLAACLEPAKTAPTGDDKPLVEDRDYEREYEDVLSEIRARPDDLNTIRHAAEVALAIGNTKAARDHYQRGLEIKPYHPRVVQEAKRNLPRSLWKTLRFLEKPPHIWEDPVRLATYPISRGPLYMLIPALVLWGLSWTVWTAVPAVTMLVLWAMEVVRVASRGDRRPPLWNGLLSDPMGTVVRPLLAAVGAVAELCLPFLMIAAVFVFFGQSGDTGLITVIRKSPIISVVMFTAGLFYIPAVLMLASAHSARVRDVLNPKYVVTAVRIMEGEYITSLVFVLLLLGVAWGLGTLVGLIPFAARLFYAAATTYVVLSSGLVLGRLHSRFKERLDQLKRGGSSDA
ncbi:MAG: hypothetical protein JSW58_15795 [Candidatus Latescibacterota bacterium]|nr:MAG: hypothetical protein JSW58_15795 [Candidatus Latescibacterota bacterium]